MLPQKISKNRFIHDIKINHKYTSFMIAELMGRKYSTSLLNNIYCFLDKEKSVQFFGEDNIIESIDLPEGLTLEDLSMEYYEDDLERFAIELKIKLSDGEEFDITKFDSILNDFLFKAETELTKRFGIIGLDYNKNKIEILEIEKWKPISIDNIVYARTVMYFM